MANPWCATHPFVDDLTAAVGHPSNSSSPLTYEIFTNNALLAQMMQTNAFPGLTPPIPIPAPTAGSAATDIHLYWGWPPPTEKEEEKEKKEKKKEKEKEKSDGPPPCCCKKPMSICCCHHEWSRIEDPCQRQPICAPDHRQYHDYYHHEHHDHRHIHLNDESRGGDRARSPERARYYPRHRSPSWDRERDRGWDSRRDRAFERSRSRDRGDRRPRSPPRQYHGRGCKCRNCCHAWLDYP